MTEYQDAVDATIDRPMPPPMPDLMGDTLAEQYIVGPFTVLDAKTWARRRTQWKDCLGLARGFGGEVINSNISAGYSAAQNSRARDVAAKRGVTAGGGAASGVRASLDTLGKEMVDGVMVSKKRVGTGGAPMPKPGRDSNNERDQGGSSFDPVCAEVHYWWFCPAGGQVLDPFAGSCVRGMVAAWRGYGYLGNDLRAEQIALNETHLDALPPEYPRPVWTCGDSTELFNVFGLDRATFDAESDGADYIFSSPPYAGLEVYSDDPRDLNNMDYAGFLAGYRSAVEQACAMLRPNRFATFVVGEVRDKTAADGRYYGFVQDTIRAFQDAGLAYYNEAILTTPIGSVGVTIPFPWATSRKLGKVHQNLLTFVKGDPKLAAEACQKGTWVESRAIAGQLLGKSEAKKIFNPEQCF